MIDYKALGLKTGLEFHQRLDSHKLFCDCESEQEENVSGTTVRKLRPTIGEMGIFDPTVLLEFSRDKTFRYQAFDKTTCLVELDEEPPHEINREAMETVLIISKLLNADISDEVHVMRKTVIDGSNTSGFQRTMMVGNSGSVDTPYGKVGINGIYLEEEACGIVEESDGVKTYRMDRLGIPLVEIATGIMTFEPKQVQDVALQLGRLLRVTGRVKRGLGTIRQDVNISIRDGARIEIKGVQDIRLLDKFIEYEVMRQKALLEIREELKERKVKPQNYDVQSFTSFFEKTKCKIIKSGTDKGQKVHGIALPHFRGILGWELSPGKRFGTELAGIAKTFGIKGVIHTDEDLLKYDIVDEVKKIYSEHNLKDDDALLLVVSEPSQSKKALEEIVKRINKALVGIPEETRKALDDGNTQFMRYISGEHRLYPETDVPHFIITEKLLKDVDSKIPEKPEVIYEKLIKEYKLSEELADKMITSKHLKAFMELANASNATLVASTLEDTLVELRRNGSDVSKLKTHHFKELFSLVSEGKIAKEAILSVLKESAANPDEKISSHAGKFETVGEEELVKALDKIISENKEVMTDKRRAFNVLMGELMKKYRGKADGALIAKIVNGALK